MSTPTRIAIFGSGNGSNFEVIARACASGEIPSAQVVLMVCDRKGAPIVQRAERLEIPALVLNPKDFASKGEYEAHIVEELRRCEVSLICLAGYMRIVGSTLLEPFVGRIINLHPSLLPSFRGAHAMEQALECGVKCFGATIHYVSEELDGGQIIDQRAFNYYGDSIEELEEIMHRVEHPLYVDSIKKIIDKK